MTFQFDTSGYVPEHPDYEGSAVFTWDGLSPFVQGYVEAMFAGGIEERAEHSAGRLYPDIDGLAFYMLASETLARIVEDCERCPISAVHGHNRPFDAVEAGARFWAMRQAGNLKTAPPLTTYLGDDGKVYLREAGQ